MKHEQKKISKIVDEVLTYFLYHFNAESRIDVFPEQGRYRMRFQFSKLDISDQQYEELKSGLVVKRQPELEDYYWQLTGEIEESNEMMLIGMMCDSIELTRNGDSIQLELVRKT